MRRVLALLLAAGLLATPALAAETPAEEAAGEIQAAMDRIAQETPDPAQPEEPEEDVPGEEERPGGLYSDLTATLQPERKVNPERRAAEMAQDEEDDEPTKRLSIDLEHLQFGKDYEIK